MVIKLRSKRLRDLFAEVIEKLPDKDRAAINERLMLVIDNSVFLPASKRPVLGAAVGVAVKKCVCLVYLSPRRLQKRSDSFVRYVIAHELAHVFLGHVERMVLSTLSEDSEEAEALYESEAQAQAERWGFPKNIPPLHVRAKRNKMAVGKERRTK